MGANSIWKNYVSDYAKENNLAEFYERFFDVFESNWKKLLSEYQFEDLCQLKDGNRLRPMLVFWGFLLNKGDDDLFVVDSDELQKITDYCVVIETIHKTSLLIDDLIDGDIARYGKDAFHAKNGTESTILIAVNLLLKSFMVLDKKIQNSPSKGLTSVYLPLRIAYDMTKGALMEVSKTSAGNLDIATTKEIINLETSAIIKGSLVIGYAAGEKADEAIIKLLDDIGHCCGYIFQALNDIEPYGNANALKIHKGKSSFDVKNNRKNIVYAYLIALMNQFETRELEDIQDEQLFYKHVIRLIVKYEIINLILEEINVLKLRIEEKIDAIQCLTSATKWARHFKKFIDLMIDVSKKRAFGDEKNKNFGL